MTNTSRVSKEMGLLKVQKEMELVSNELGRLVLEDGDKVRICELQGELLRLRKVAWGLDSDYPTRDSKEMGLDQIEAEMNRLGTEIGHAVVEGRVDSEIRAKIERLNELRSVVWGLTTRDSKEMKTQGD